jgi:hypothetical protein
MLKEIADLTGKARDSRFKAMAAERSLENSFTAYAGQRGLLELAVREISRKLAEKLGDELYPHAIKLLECSRVPDIIELSRIMSYDEKLDVMIIQGEIPTLRYSVQVLRSQNNDR